MSDANDLKKLGFLFAHGTMVKSGDVELGKGVFEKDLERWGYSKKQLGKLVASGVLTKTTTRYQGGWRNTYVLPQVNE